MGKRIISTSIIKNKTMRKQNKTGRRFSFNVRSTPFLVLSSLLVVGLAIAAPLVRADQFDEQISTLRQQNADAQGSLNGLQAQASSYQDAINQLQVQISAIQAA